MSLHHLPAVNGRGEIKRKPGFGMQSKVAVKARITAKALGANIHYLVPCPGGLVAESDPGGVQSSTLWGDTSGLLANDWWAMRLSPRRPV